MGSFVAINLCAGLGEGRYTYPLFPSPLVPCSPSYAPGATRSFASRVIDMYLSRQRHVLLLHTMSGAPALDKNSCPLDRYFWVEDYKTPLISDYRQLTPSPVTAHLYLFMLLCLLDEHSCLFY